MNLPKFLTHQKAPALLTALMFGGVSLTAFHTIQSPPLFPNTDNFVFFADQSINLDQDTTISSGDLGTNGKLEIGKDTTVNGNLFADTITIDKNTSINGNTTFNTLKNQGETLGTKTTPVSLPIANLPAIPNFSIGAEDRIITGTATLLAGNYKNITLQKDFILTLSGGTYNLNTLELQEHSTLVFNAPTVLNIKSKLKGGNNVSISNGANAKHDDLHINYLGAKGKEKDGDVIFGKNSFLNFTLLAPNASVSIGKDSILRGRVLGRRVTIGKNAIVSRSEAFEKESDSSGVVTDTDGAKFIGNETIVLFDDTATFMDALAVAKSVNGTLSGFLASPPTYKIVLPTRDVASMREAIRIITSANNSLVLEIVPNFISESF